MPLPDAYTASRLAGPASSAMRGLAAPDTVMFSLKNTVTVMSAFGPCALPASGE